MHHCNKLIKSPLRYPGGKSRAVKQILQYFPNNIKTVCSPFLGGGAIELELIQTGVVVYGYDSFEPLIEFWQELLRDPIALSNRVYKYYPLSKQRFNSLQKTFEHLQSKKARAAAFFALNRASFSGVTFNGGMSPHHPRFNSHCIKNLKSFVASRLHVKCMDFIDSIKNHQHDFLYLDPPYYNTLRLYGNHFANNTFNHERLSHMLKKRTRWLLSYNDCEYIRSLYKGHRIVTLFWKYGMNTSKQSKEILIFSKD